MSGYLVLLFGEWIIVPYIGVFTIPGVKPGVIPGEIPSLLGIG